MHQHAPANRSAAIADFLRLDRPLDCDEGRRLGCANFCCALMVRLKPGEQDPGAGTRTGPACIDKHPDTGRCVYQDADTGRCRVYACRPEVCMIYDCRDDPLLSVVLDEGFQSIGQLVERLTLKITDGSEV